MAKCLQLMSRLFDCQDFTKPKIYIGPTPTAFCHRHLIIIPIPESSIF